MATTLSKLTSGADLGKVTTAWIKQETATARQSLLHDDTPAGMRFQSLRSRWAKLQLQLERDRDLLHRVTCTILGAFDIRVLPWLDVGGMVAQKGPRGMSKRTKRQALLLGHGMLRQRLMHHCSNAGIKARSIVWITEQFTSKLCGCCFRYCGYLKGSRVFKCPNRRCGRHLSRDGNAARNIWIWAWLLAAEQFDQDAAAATPQFR